MRYALFFSLIVLGSYACAQENAAPDISAYIGRDVREMEADERQQFIALFRSISGDPEALPSIGDDNWEYVPQSLYEFTDPTFRFFVEIAPGFQRPGFCGLRIHVFDDDWKYVRQQAFSTGYRQEIKEVSKSTATPLGTEVLVVKTIRAGPWEVTRDGEVIGTPFFEGKYQLQYSGVVQR